MRALSGPGGLGDLGAIEGPWTDLTEHTRCRGWWEVRRTTQRDEPGQKALREAPPPRPGSAATQASALMNESFMPWTGARSDLAAPSPALGS